MAKATSLILDAVLEGARDLHSAGFLATRATANRSARAFPN